MVDIAEISRLKEECCIIDYYPTSAKTPRGLAALGKAITWHIKWEELSKTTRPRLFQIIREFISERQNNGDVVLLYSGLENAIRERAGNEFDKQAVNAVVSQLAGQGTIVDTRLATGEWALILQIGFISIYAGSLVFAAKSNPRGVPALEEYQVISGRLPLLRIRPEDRLDPLRERIIMECVVQLLLDRGICFKHGGLLIFPTEFRQASEKSDKHSAQIVPLYYDFSGPIDNIYASLVTQLAVSEKFGRIRLWQDHTEYDSPATGVCGLRKRDRKSGLAHLDLLFSENVDAETRNLFTVFVEEHLRKEGIAITEVLEMVCGCGHCFEESVIEDRIRNEHADVGCPRCDKRLKISEGAQKARTSVESELFALKTQIEKKKRADIDEVKREFRNFGKADVHGSGISTAKALSVQTQQFPVSILHLSDLHFSESDNPIVRLQPLISDLIDREEGFGYNHLDYLVVSGDLTNQGTHQEYEKVHIFLSEMVKKFKLSAQRCIIVPGNHDLNWDVAVYNHKAKRAVDVSKLPADSYVEQEKVYLIRDDTAYPKRFENFTRFYHQFTQQEYPLSPETQGFSLLFEENGIQFLAMNSSWQIDEYYPKRSSINEVCLANVLLAADGQIDSAKKQNRMDKDAKVLRIAVWHHPVTSNDKIVNDEFLERLRKADFKLCLHGHIHEERADVIGYLPPTRKIHVAGAGSFSVVAAHRPKDTPRIYNVIEILRDHSMIKVHTRCMRRDGGAWEPWAVWPDDTNKHTKKGYYEIKL
ncbi:MAG TPA: metallophosphoesterase family protein [Candidatus Wunengus sp. YC60]|uniref:metallophosphoesterase family protein n=1 Tax=Candidatus Wunengus sp. YC60 TaxID=3367697 RepID=UPI004025B3AC